MDANGILNVTAKEMSTGNAKNITIKNDKGRLSQAEIDRMVREAEEYAGEDEKYRQRVAARNQLETYAFGAKQAAEEAGNKISSSDKSKVLEKCNETVKWLDGNTTAAEKEEYEYKLEELTKICQPIMTKMHQSAGGAGPQAANCGQQAAGGFGSN